MQEAQQAHLIECDTSKIPFLCALINYIKEHKLAASIWGGHTHITETVDWDSPKGDLSCFVRMSQDHTCYNMSVISVKVQGISNINKIRDYLLPNLGRQVGRAAAAADTDEIPKATRWQPPMHRNPPMRPPNSG
jgi:hypothetical protein